MIRYIGLRHWRAYEQLELPLTGGVTYFVAPNGVGKSSLVEAVRWCLLGGPEDRSRGRAVRAGHQSATVELVLDLPQHSDVRVARTLKRSGGTTFSATVDGDAVSESQYLSILSDSWAADPGVLDSVIFGPANSSKATPFPVRDHLAAAFGIEPLLNAASTVKTRRDALATRIKSLRDDLSATTDAIEVAVRVVGTLGTDVEAAVAARRLASDALAEFEVSAEHAVSWQRYRAAAREYTDRTKALVVEMSNVVAVGDGDPHEAVDEAHRRTLAAVDEGVAAQSAAQLRAATSASAADLLAAASGQCPTCLRPLTDHERNDALAAHGERSDGAQGEIEHHERDTARAREQLAAIMRFSAALSDLHQPAEPEYPDPGPQTLTARDAARDQLAEVAERHGGLQARMRAAQQDLDDLRAAAADQAVLTQVAREDLILEVTHKSLTAVADRYLTERIEPLATEISHRWKLLFGAEGLRFAPTGSLTFAHADIDLALQDLSGGERAIALVITRLLLAASATRASTIWFDEPLEHLDPTRRAAVAQTLAQAAQNGAVSQILVTTYEEGLARRLAATSPDAVTLTYARSTPI